VLLTLLLKLTDKVILLLILLSFKISSSKIDIHS